MCIFFLQLIDTQFKQSPPAAHRFAMAAVLLMEALHFIAQFLGPAEIRQLRDDIDEAERVRLDRADGPALSALRAVCRSEFNHQPIQVWQLRDREFRRRLALQGPMAAMVPTLLRISLEREAERDDALHYEQAEIRRSLARMDVVRRDAWINFHDLTFVRGSFRVGRAGSGRDAWERLHEVMISLLRTAGVRSRTRAGAEAMPGSLGASVWMGPDPLPARYGRLGQVARAEELLSEWVPSYFILPPQ